MGEEIHYKKEAGRLSESNELFQVYRGVPVFSSQGKGKAFKMTVFSSYSKWRKEEFK
jgi:hypothetical protein